ncbi:MAG: hypothetical protein HOE76_00155 [Euryarchaeota archaeon]|nr:hypothetical protein [Euryarchaeota archaeon]
MQKIPVVICLMMMAVSLSGCIGGEVETSDGEELILEDTDDWPTYYVPTSGDLPACDSTTLGRLYYVEAETNFQACSSSGWNVIDFSTPLNQAPRISATITADDDGHSFSEDLSAEWMYVGQLTWSAVDPEGEAVTVGVDYDRDGTADIMLPRAEGSIVDVAGGMLTVPWNGSIVSERLELPNNCYLAFTRMIDLISTDASGISASYTVQTGAISSDDIFRNMYSAEDVDWVEMLFENYVSQDDLDWLDGTATDSNCEAESDPGPGLSMYHFTAQDSGVVVGSASDDVLFSITYSQGSDIEASFLKITLSVNGNQPVQCYESTGTGECTYEIVDVMLNVGDSFDVSEDGTDLCNEGHDPCEISITIVNSDTNDVLDNITVEVE